MARELPIAGYEDISVSDYEKHICLKIYTLGCNMGCPFCHSTGLVRPDGQVGLISEDEVLTRAEQEKGLIDSICISGGEPTLHDLKPFLKKVKAMGLGVKIDTNGTNPDELKKLVDEGLVDYVAMDYKTPKDDMEELCGGKFSKDDVVESKKFLMNQNKADYEFKTTVVPTMHDKNDLRQIAKELQGAKRWRLQQFQSEDDAHNVLINPENEDLRVRAYPCNWYDDIMAELGKEIKDIGIRGCE